MSPPGRLRCVSVLVLVLASSLAQQGSAQQQQQQQGEARRQHGYVGIIGPDLHVLPPDGPGAVLIDGVDVKSEMAELNRDVGDQAEAVSLLRAGHEEDMMLLSAALCDSGTVERVSVALSIDTLGAQDIKRFHIDGVDYLGVANWYDGKTHDVDSVVYKISVGDNGLALEQLQVLATKGATDMELITSDNEVYLVVTTEYDDNTNILDSPVYKWDRAAGRFDPSPHSTIPTIGAWDAEQFVIADVQYLAVANWGSGLDPSTVRRVKSPILAWDTANARFQTVQSLDTIGARSFKHFSINGDHFLAVANLQDVSTYKVPSVVYIWNAETAQFEVAQSFDTLGAADWEYFEADGVHVLCVANYYDDASHTLLSDVFAFNATTRKFDKIQAITTKGARDWEHFRLGRKHYMALAQYRDVNNVDTPSAVFQWNPATRQLDKLLELDTHGAVGWHRFSIGRSPYLAVANEQSGATAYQTASTLFAWNPACAF